MRQSAPSETEGLNESGSDNGEDIVGLKSEEHCNVNEWCDIFSRLEFTRHFNFLIWHLIKSAEIPDQFGRDIDLNPVALDL